MKLLNLLGSQESVHGKEFPIDYIEILPRVTPYNLEVWKC